MRKASIDKAVDRTRSRLRQLVWPVLAAIVFGLIGFGELLEDALRIARNNLHHQSASGDIVLVEVDDRSLREVGSWPWPRATQARIVDEASRLGAKRMERLSNRRRPISATPFSPARTRQPPTIYPASSTMRKAA